MDERRKQAGNRVKHFEDLEVWQLGRELVLAVYGITASFPDNETYGLTAQIRRASVSVPANIAEGFGRYHYRDKVRFLLQARGSLHELRSHLLIAQALGFISNEGLRPVLTLLQNLNVKINNLIAVLRTRASRD